MRTRIAGVSAAGGGKAAVETGKGGTHPPGFLETRGHPRPRPPLRTDPPEKTKGVRTGRITPAAPSASLRA